MAKAARLLPNEGHDYAATGVAIAPCPPATRTTLRGTPKAYAKTLGFALPTTIGTFTSDKAHHALMLGPDEWMVIDGKAGVVPMPKALPKAYTIVEISHRNTGWTLTGANATNALAVGCPRDLRDEAFPVGACARTVFGKAEILLMRTGKQAWRVECWRSFAPYVFTLLKDGARDASL